MFFTDIWILLETDNINVPSFPFSSPHLIVVSGNDSLMLRKANKI